MSFVYWRYDFLVYSRYHLEDGNRFAEFVPGQISAKLRKALGLPGYRLPRHIYRMRLLGYPPGWLEDARISHSGLALYDSQGKGKFVIAAYHCAYVCVFCIFKMCNLWYVSHYANIFQPMYAIMS